ncbi:hypothetical protein BX616_009399 [Lobosporangium transversale]|uniref:Phosphatidylglycerol/phosphatidylinositol transfer protein n=1 Tax=Lobosporangium transversale TaxID=64571 RepID=A0A1Y2GGB5_9FUNG|nr:hypothetical protein BCR41DRAFT_425028 [Lobosporangium transversale]KAF9913879.1 hypothetical protein BX616_009399 [Lobosporangium transversale]ORZ06790.1 hypothetical protein BCR41DRAFT_425028 [Lobosporangium transversale]|eukprot:XP_021877711.1 hypothetical protein BCR41DRAFT_425028 [Lobosporangium transversale]
MKFITAVAAFVLAAVANAQTQPTFTNCATGATDLVINSFSLSPYPLCIGQNVCATGNGQLSAPVTAGAKLNIVGKYLNRIVYTDAHDLCTLLGNQGHPCPVPVTLTSITACVLVKTTAPAGIPVQLQISATNGNGHVLFCQSANGVLAQNC